MPTEKTKILIEVEAQQKKVDELREAIIKLRDARKEEIKQLKLAKKEQDELNKSFKAGDISLEDYEKALKKNGETQKKYNKAIKESDKLINDLNAEYKESNRELNINKKIVNEEIGSLNQLRALLIKNQKAWDGLSKEQRENSAEGKKLSATLKGLNKDVSRLEQSTNRHQRNVGNYGSAWKSVGSQLKNVAGVFGMAGGISMGIQLLTRVVKDAIKTNIEFGKQMSTVKSITQASNTEFKLLKQNAKDLGSTTSFTAIQVGELQESLARLGFGANAILDMTGALLDLSVVAKTDLAEASDLAGASIKVFGLQTSDTQEIVDSMTATFNNSGAKFEDYKETFKYAAPIFDAANLTFKDMNRLTGVLADGQIRGSLAGTGLKNIISKLSDENSKLSKHLGFTVKNSDDLDRAFAVLKTQNIDLTKATELTDERSKAAFLTLISGVDASSKLSIALDNLDNNARKTAETMLDNLAGDMTKAQSAWEGFVLSLDDGEGTMNKASRGFVQLGTEILASVTKGNALTEFIGTLFAEFKNLFSALSDVAKSLGLVSEKGDAVNMIFSALTGVFKIAMIPVRALVSLFTKLYNVIATVNNFVTDTAKSFVNFINKFEAGRVVLDTIKTLFQGVGNEIKRMLEFLGILDTAQEKAAKASAKAAKESDIQKKQELKQEFEIQKEIEKTNKIKEDNHKQELQNLKELEKEKQAIRDKYGLTSQQEFYNRELDLLKEHKEKMFLTEEEFETKRYELWNKYNGIEPLTEHLQQTDEIIENNQAENLQKTIDLEQTKTQVVIGEDEKKIKFGDIAGKQQLETISNTTNQAAALFKEHTIAYKGLASATALMDTYAAAMAAYKSTAEIPIVGAFLAPIQAALAVATGLANVAKINSISFSEGGYTGTGGKYESAGIVHKGEVVFSQKDISMLGGVNAVNSMRPTAGYADGGVVGNTITNNILTNDYGSGRTVYQPILVTSDLDQVRVEENNVIDIESN